MLSIPTPVGFASAPVSFGIAQADNPPGKLKRVFVFPDGETKVYMSYNEAKKTCIFYIRPNSSASQTDIERLMDYQDLFNADFKKQHPTWTVATRLFDDRPENAVVIDP